MQELFASETVYPQERDELQLRIFSAAENFGGGSAFSLEYGLTDSLQLEVGSGYGFQFQEPETEFGLQWSFMDLKRLGVDIALGWENEARNGQWFSEQRVHTVIAKEIDGLFGGTYLFGNVGFAVHEAEDAEEPEGEEEGTERWDVSSGFVTRLTRSLRMTQEVAWAEPTLDRTGGRQLRWVPGVVWIMPTGAELGFGVSVSLNQGEPFWMLSFVQEFDGVLGR